MDRKIKVCDICGQQQQTANGWLPFRIDQLIFFAWKDEKKRKGRADACGRACLVKAFSKWLEEVHVNAPVEVKKDEIQN